MIAETLVWRRALGSACGYLQAPRDPIEKLATDPFGNSPGSLGGRSIADRCGLERDETPSAPVLQVAAAASLDRIPETALRALPGERGRRAEKPEPASRT